MKKQKSSTIVLSEFLSSDDETEKATPKIDKEELRKYLKTSDDEDESSPDQITPKTSPQRPNNVKRLKTPPIEDKPIIKTKKVISKIHFKIILFKVTISKNFRKRQRNLVLIHSSILKEKITNT